MGYIKHNAIIATSWEDELLTQAQAKAKALGMAVSPLVKSKLNGYASILIAPDGSKEGWEDSDVGDAQREALCVWLNSQRYEDGSSSLEWCQVAYGSDDAGAEIVNHGFEWVLKNRPYV